MDHPSFSIAKWLWLGEGMQDFRWPMLSRSVAFAH